jgi:hypothetical protein
VDDPLAADFAAALAAALPVAIGPLDLTAYVVSLCHSWHSAHATPPALVRASARFAALSDRTAADLAARKAREEAGHDRLVLRDLAALELPADLPYRVASRFVHELVARYHAMADEPAPYGVFGHAYALERFAALVTATDIAAIQALATAGRDITRSRRVHSDGGADHDHAAELADFAARLPADGLARVAAAVRATVPCAIAAATDPAPRAALACWLTVRGHDAINQER